MQENRIDGLYPRQHDLIRLASEKQFTLAYGASRGGKSYTLILAMIYRGIAFPGTSHCIVRKIADTIETTAWKTIMECLEAVAPGYATKCDINHSLRRVRLHTGSEIWCFGANDEERVAKLMGSQFQTMLLNEVVDFDFKTYGKLVTRLNANPLTDIDSQGNVIPLKLWADCNPKAKSHWVYQQWCLHLVPGTKRPLWGAEDFGFIQFDRHSNPDVEENYYNRLQNNSDEDVSSYLLGEWYDEVVGAYFTKPDIEANREETPKDFDLVSIGVDPATTDGPDSDETGIIVAGVKIVGDDERHYYPLADLSGRYHPRTIAQTVAKAYDDYGAGVVVIETNQGGNYNVTNLQTVNPSMNIVTVHAGAGQGKNARAQPIASLMKGGRIHHPLSNGDTEVFAELEEQMVKITGDYDRKRNKSPDRLDAYVYAISELMTGDHFAKPVVQSKIAGFFR